MTDEPFWCGKCKTYYIEQCKCQKSSESASNGLLSFTWSSEQPTKEGWYWLRQYKDSVPEIVKVDDKRDIELWDQNVLDLDHAEWAGPIQMPSER